jgi:sarcosine oxidase subunit beta
MPRSASALPDSADVVIIGGGVIDTSAAFHLAEAGVHVVLVERAQLGSGSTSRAAGGVRTQFSDALNVEIAKRSLDAFRDFGRRPGWEIDLKQVGYLFVLNREADVEKFERSVALQNEYGLASRMLTAAEVRELCPLVRGDDILAGAFSPARGPRPVDGDVSRCRWSGAIATACTSPEGKSRSVCAPPFDYVTPGAC